MSKWLLQLIANLGIEREDSEPFTVAALYEMTKIGEQIVRSMTMLTINADNHPFTSQFHKPEDEKRSIVVIEPEHLKDWLNMTHESAYKLLLPMGAGYVAEHCPKPKKRLKRRKWTYLAIRFSY